MQRETLALAIEALSWMELRRINGRLALKRTTAQLGIQSEAAMRQAFRLIMETTRRLNVIDHLVAQALEQETLDDLSLGVRSFLRLYASEVKYGQIALKDAVEIAALAREILGSKELSPVEEAIDLIPHLEVKLEGLHKDEATALLTFHPSWFVSYCRELLGMEETLHFLQAPDPPTYVRINILRGAKEDLLKRIEEEGVTMEEAGLEYAYRVIDSSRPLTLLGAYQEGLFTVQDKASILAGLVAAPKQGMTVLDVCAAPGTKTSHLAQQMENQGRVLSLDYSERRLETWESEMGRLGVENAEAVLMDARDPGSFPDLEADLVLVDPPCTGTGTFNRIPSGKWRLTSRSIERMAAIQRRILDNCAAHVKKDGRLLYCTCSITKEENEMVVSAFLRAHPALRLLDAAPRLGSSGFMGQWQSQRLYPHLHGCNGFYLALLEKTSD